MKGRHNTETPEGNTLVNLTLGLQGYMLEAEGVLHDFITSGIFLSILPARNESDHFAGFRDFGGNGRSWEGSVS